MESDNIFKIGLVYYWQDGGWHGTNIITRISKRFVWVKTYPFKKEDKEHRKSKKDLLTNKYCFNQFTRGGKGEYVGLNKHVGEVKPINI